MITPIRQLKLSGIPKDRAVAVKQPPSPHQAFPVPQKGIWIGQNWKVGADPYNVVLYRRVKSKSGKEVWETYGYYSTLGNVLIGLIRQGVRDTELKDIQAVQDKIAQLEQAILKMAARK
jgi:hypothetical protein